jgi:hypothetical protein
VVRGDTGGGDIGGDDDGNKMHALRAALSRARLGPQCEAMVASTFARERTGAHQLLGAIYTHYLKAGRVQLLNAVDL